MLHQFICGTTNERFSVILSRWSEIQCWYCRIPIFRHLFPHQVQPNHVTHHNSVAVKRQRWRLYNMKRYIKNTIECVRVTSARACVSLCGTWERFHPLLNADISFSSLSYFIWCAVCRSFCCAVVPYRIEDKNRSMNVYVSSGSFSQRLSPPINSQTKIVTVNWHVSGAERVLLGVCWEKLPSLFHSKLHIFPLSVVTMTMPTTTNRNSKRTQTHQKCNQQNRFIYRFTYSRASLRGTVFEMIKEIASSILRFGTFECCQWWWLGWWRWRQMPLHTHTRSKRGMSINCKRTNDGQSM